MIGLIFVRVIVKFLRIWVWLWVFCSLNIVWWVMILWWCSIKVFKVFFRLKILGWLLFNVIILILNIVCNCVLVYKWLSSIFVDLLCLIFIIICILFLLDLLWSVEIFLICFFLISLVIFLIKWVLLIWYGILLMIMVFLLLFFVLIFVLVCIYILLWLVW